MSITTYTNGMGNIVIKNVNEDIRRKFKALCALEGKNMTEKLVLMIEREITKQEKK